MALRVAGRALTAASVGGAAWLAFDYQSKVVPPVAQATSRGKCKCSVIALPPVSYGGGASTAGGAGAPASSAPPADRAGRGETRGVALVRALVPGAQPAAAAGAASGGPVAPAFSLSAAERARFEREGYVVVRGLLPRDFVEGLGAASRAYKDEYRGIQHWFRTYSGRSAIHCPSHHAGWARDAVTDPHAAGAIGAVTASLLRSGEEPLRVVLDTLDIIPLGQASSSTAPFRRVDGVRVWVPFEPISVNSAPLVLVPRSHRYRGDCITGHYEDPDKPLW
jgi:hypothetical protein